MLEGLISRSPFMSAKQCGMLSLLMVAGFACSDDDTNSAVSSAGGASGAAGSGGLATLEAGLRSEGAAGLGGSASQAEGGDTEGGTFSTLRVQRTNLVSDEADAGAVHVDPNVVNAWGLAFGPTGLAWISDNGTGKASVYAADGTMQSLVVTIRRPVTLARLQHLPEWSSIPRATSRETNSSWSPRRAPSPVGRTEPLP